MLAAAQPLAAAYGARISVVDIDTPGNEGLEASYGERVPVLFAGALTEEALICAIRLDPASLRVALTGARNG